MKYLKKNVKTISLSEAIRLRPAMYLGSVDQKGIENIIADLLNTSSSGLVKFDLQGDIINLKIEVIESSKYRKPFENIVPQYDEFSQIYVLACLSSNCQLLIEGEDNIVLHMIGKRGVFDCQFQTVEHYAYKHGRFLNFTFTCDNEIFKDLNLRYDYFLNFFQEQSFLLPQLMFDISFSINHIRLHNRNGIFDYANMFIHKLGRSPQIRIDELFNLDEYIIQWTICLMDISFWEDIHFESWINNEFIYGGSLHEGIKKGIIGLLEKQKLDRCLLEKMLVCVQIRGKHFSYKRSLKTYLDMPLLENKLVDHIMNESKISSVSLNH